MARFYFDDDADLRVLDGRRVAVIGYGNQGRAQALNMRDSGVDVMVGSIRDDGYARAEEDGFPVRAIGEAVEEADIIFLLLPDEVQREVYDEEVARRLRDGQTLNFAHGYNIRYGYIRPPAGVDVVMVAPRMIGVGVRERYLAGGGAPAFLAVEQDATGRAKTTALALARAIGATRAGVLETTFAEETELDLFTEQALWPAVFRTLMLSFDVLVEKGYQPEAVLLELYASGEASQVFKEMAEVGLFRQMRLHSQTSQYGTLTRSERMDAAPFRAVLEQALGEIRDGRFAREWEAEREGGYVRFESLRSQAMAHPINGVEETLSRSRHDG
jgi:ketol-acid reductoisomerase